MKLDRTSQRRIATLGRRIQDLISEGSAEEAVSVLTSSLKATKRVRRREGGGPVEYEDAPDYPTRLAAARTLLEFKYGKPKQQVTLSHDDEPGRQKGRDEVLAALQADWERTREIGDTWIEGMKQAEKPEAIETPCLVDVDID